MNGQRSATTAMPFFLHASTAVLAVPEPLGDEETGTGILLKSRLNRGDNHFMSVSALARGDVTELVR